MAYRCTHGRVHMEGDLRWSSEPGRATRLAWHSQLASVDAANARATPRHCERRGGCAHARRCMRRHLPTQDIVRHGSRQGAVHPRVLVYDTTCGEPSAHAREMWNSGRPPYLADEPRPSVGEH